MGVLFGMLMGAIYLFYLARFYDLQMFAWMGSFIVGLFWQQIAFIGHDLGHNGITHDVWWDTFIGFFIGNFGQGISMGWWKYTHNVQHIHWFFTILLSRVFIYGSSLYFVFVQQPKQLNGKNEPYRFYNQIEQLSLIGYHIWTISLFYFCTDSPFLCYFIAYSVAGILHIQIIMNHFPCPIFDGIEEDNFVVHQLKSSMAIESNTLTHWFYGGLQFQVEHHLFPMMPRHNLRKVKPYILSLCRKYDLPYLENSFLGAVFDIFYILKDVAKHADKINELNFLAKAN